MQARATAYAEKGGWHGPPIIPGRYRTDRRRIIRPTMVPSRIVAANATATVVQGVPAGSPPASGGEAPPPVGVAAAPSANARPCPSQHPPHTMTSPPVHVAVWSARGANGASIGTPSAVAPPNQTPS